MYNEKDITWSSIEKYYNYSKVKWSIQKNGIPKYTFFDENDNEIEINIGNTYKENEQSI